ncbi:hypothetical protein KYI09_06415 [Macrococcoides caseolyticum]|uniref:hypothetical protein n=1 Tax=Macrococcoides caseolyticum TaxID=69966 RepID=UPI001C5F91E9|nr:hypothetical protein [Macrococcus caseolyticus]QYA39254.1 hypothetical protein KYI09_06415 [Macrococcus caseolyticus]
MNEWKKFDKDFIKKKHDDMYFYRDLYDGKHANIFPRAKELISKGEIIDILQYGEYNAKNVMTPYLMLNICKIIVDTPSLLISRGIGKVKTNFPNKEELANDTTTEEAKMIEGTVDNSYNSEVIDLQQETIDQIVKNSKIDHKMNITQLLVDGGIVAVPSMINGQLKLMFKERNVYYPHDDGHGYDLVYELPQTEEEKEAGIDYVHIYTEREDEDRLLILHKLFKRNGESQLEEVEDLSFIQEKIGIEQLYQEFEGRKRSFISYLANNATFYNKLGASELKGLAGRQDEVNWTLTRASQTFERNGKPRISITRETMDTLRAIAADRYGDENKIDHRDLEIQEIGENGQVMQIHQIDVDKIGDMAYLKDIIRGMLAETQTSQAAMEFVRTDTASPQSGVAKFYDLLVSLMKAEQIRNDYVEFLKKLFESALWLANKENDSIIIEEPNITVQAMIPVPEKEITDANIAKYNAKVQSLEETVRLNNPDKTDEWVYEEVERIKSESTSQDSMSVLNGNNTLNNFLNNRQPDGTPLDELGNPIKE